MFATIPEEPREALAMARRLRAKTLMRSWLPRRFLTHQLISDAELLMQESVLQDNIIRIPNQVEAVLSTMERRA